ncbi:cuticle protein 10.9-like [Daphnia pulex]|uniref:cuticle protein 10.9-like n=1 Tax=Daphnia pulex TaxID=6669 RepID=UPI001EDFBF24|nr:cuticle protein 10.9-like [Daphnia pulex]
MKFLILVSLIAVVAAKSAYPTKDYSSPAYEKPAESYKPQPYSFEWAVKDESYNDYSHTQSSDGKVITGSYRMELPDGRAQIVNYKADSNGYTADVTYEGEAQYPPVTYSASAYSASVYNAPTYPAFSKIPVSEIPTYKSPTYKSPSRY